MRAHALALRLLGALVLPGVVGVLFAEAQACNPACTGPERSFSGGNRFGSGSDLWYETSGERGPFLPFEGGADLHLRHELGLTPYQINIFLSFNEYPTDDSNGGYAPSAGNQTVILFADEHEVRIRNDTCSDYWIRVVVHANADESAEANDGATDAGAETTSDAPLETASDADAPAETDAD